MKKSPKKLGLHRETLRNLTSAEASRLAGGTAASEDATCSTCSCVTCLPTQCLGGTDIGER